MNHERDIMVLFFFKYVYPLYFQLSACGYFKFHILSLYPTFVVKPFLLNFFMGLKLIIYLMVIVFYGILLKIYSNYFLYLFVSYVVQSMVSLYIFNLIVVLLHYYDDFLVFYFSDLLIDQDLMEEFEITDLDLQSIESAFKNVNKLKRLYEEEQVFLTKDNFIKQVNNFFFKDLIKLRDGERKLQKDFEKGEMDFLKKVREKKRF